MVCLILGNSPERTLACGPVRPADVISQLLFERFIDSLAVFEHILKRFLSGAGTLGLGATIETNCRIFKFFLNLYGVDPSYFRSAITLLKFVFVVSNVSVWRSAKLKVGPLSIPADRFGGLKSWLTSVDVVGTVAEVVLVTCTSVDVACLDVCRKLCGRSSLTLCLLRNSPEHN